MNKKMFVSVSVAVLVIFLVAPVGGQVSNSTSSPGINADGSVGLDNSTATPTPTVTPTATVTPTPTPSVTPIFNAPVMSELYVGQQLISIPVFTPAVVTVTFEASTNRSQQVSKSYNSHHTENYNDGGGYAVFTFTTFDSDIFTITLDVRYTSWVTQDVTIRAYGNGSTGSAFVLPIAMTSMGFVLNFQVLTSVAPSYPSAEQIAAVRDERFTDKLDNVTSHFDSVTDEIQTSSAISNIFGVIAFFGVIALFVLLLWRERKHSLLEADVRRIREAR